MTDAEIKKIHRIFTATLIIGVSGSGKTSLLATFARYLWETYGRVLFLYSWDGGAIPTEIQKCMRQGIIRFWRVRTRSASGLGIETLYQATKGYVPKHINPETGETSPAVELIPPVQTKYVAYCPQGHQILNVPGVSMLVNTYCQVCKTMIGRDGMRVTEESRRTKGLELIGGVAYDGLSSMSTVVMDHMDHARGAGLIGGEKSAFGGVVESGSVRLGGNNRADVGFGQSRAQQFVNNSLSIPYLVEGPVFTALSFEASEEGLAIVGPKLPGRAATDEAPSWFGNVCETAKVKDDEGKQHYTLFLRPFTDLQNRRHLLKTSASPDGLPDYLQDPPEDAKTPFEKFNLGLMFKMLDDDLTKAVGTSGPLTGGMTDYGEPVLAEQSAQAGPASAAPAQALPPAQPAAPAPVPTPRPRARAAAPAPVQATSEPAAEAPAPAVAPPPPPPGAKPPQRAPGT